MTSTPPDKPMPTVDDAPASLSDITSMSLRADRLRRRLISASGGHTVSDPGLSPAAPARDPELVNRWAKIGFACGVVAVFVNFYFVPSALAVVFCLMGFRQATLLARRGKAPYGRGYARWGLGFAAFGVATVLFSLFVRPLFR